MTDAKSIETKATVQPCPADGWDVQECDALIDELWSLRTLMVEHEASRLKPWLNEVDPAHALSAANLAHFLAMRSVDLRRLQDHLARLGVSSLGRSETHVLANLDKVLGILHRLAGRQWNALTKDEPLGSRRGPAMLQRNAKALLGARGKQRSVRIMVTLPGESAESDELIDSLVEAGMDIARINCAHDTAPQWASMAKRVRKAARRAQREVRVLMDLGGPKLRTGPIAGGPAVVKLKPRRDESGRLLEPARLGLRPRGSTWTADNVDTVLGVDAAWFERLQAGDRIRFKDARSAARKLRVVECNADRVIVECDHTAYLTADTRLQRRRRGAKKKFSETGVYELPMARGMVHLQRGDIVQLLAHGVGHDAEPAGPAGRSRPAAIPCTLPQALEKARKGQHIWFDDGRIGGVVHRKLVTRLDVKIVHARDGGERLVADKGINLPDTELDLPALTEKDIEDLETVARHADIVGLSFCQSADDVRALRARLLELGASHLGLLLKIETKRGFEHLPEMLLAAMGCSNAGVMIARGDLAVECGYERMAEVQEEILWACEAAHMPVVWATQVLETLAKTGLPSRAEITDAAMGERAECVMLNKGPHILDAIRTLADILGRMQAHQAKKRPLMRALKSWARALETGAKREL